MSDIPKQGREERQQACDADNLALPISDEWLGAVGFKYQQPDQLRPESKHWLLWLGDVLDGSEKARRFSFTSFEDLGVEVSAGNGFWFCWLRADYAGRYSRFIHIRHITSRAQLVEIIEGVTGQEWTLANNWYGLMVTPERAERNRQEWDRLDSRIAREGWRSDPKPDEQLRQIPAPRGKQ